MAEIVNFGQFTKVEVSRNLVKFGEVPETCNLWILENHSCGPLMPGGIKKLCTARISTVVLLHITRDNTKIPEVKDPLALLIL